MPSKSAHKSKWSRSNRSWKDIQYSAKLRKRTKLAIFVLVFVAGLLVVSWAIRFTQSLFAPFKSNAVQASQRRNYNWNGEFNINLLIQTNNISLFVYNPKEQKIFIVNIPDEVFLDVPRGFGKWQLRSVYELGQTRDGIGGDNLLKETLVSFFNLPIDGFMDLSSLHPQKNAFELINNFKKNPIAGLETFSALKTDLTILEILKLKIGIAGVRFDKVKEINLSELNILSQENLPDGSGVLTADPAKLESIMSNFADPAIIAEHKTIAVLNATDMPQLAEKWSKLITNLGGDVIIISNAKQKLKNSRIIGDESLTIKRLRQIIGNLDCSNNPKCDKIDFIDDQISSRAEINVFLGEDL